MNIISFNCDTYMLPYELHIYNFFKKLSDLNPLNRRLEQAKNKNKQNKKYKYLSFKWETQYLELSTAPVESAGTKSTQTDKF